MKQKMKQQLIFILLFILVLFSCNKVEKIYYPDGSIAAEYPVKKGLKNGVAYQYDKAGNKIAEMNYSNNLLNGDYKEYYTNGSLKSIIQYTNNKKNGLAIYYDIQGNVIEELIYENDTLNGIYREYYSNNMIKREGYYKKGNFDSTWRYYSENGFLIGIGHFDNGRGVLKTYYPYSDKIHSITNFENNKKNGLEIVLSMNGDTIAKNYYKDDIKIIK
jgi:antitoxin component YwqK of YwqJK toxin-antitoxin module